MCLVIWLHVGLIFIKWSRVFVLRCRQNIFGPSFRIWRLHHLVWQCPKLSKYFFMMKGPCVKFANFLVLLVIDVRTKQDFCGHFKAESGTTLCPDFLLIVSSLVIVSMYPCVKHYNCCANSFPVSEWVTLNRYMDRQAHNYVILQTHVHCMHMGQLKTLSIIIIVVAARKLKKTNVRQYCTRWIDKSALL